MGLGAKLTDSKIPQEKLPLKLAAISRCYRAETSRLAEERGIYRYCVKKFNILISL